MKNEFQELFDEVCAPILEGGAFINADSKRFESIKERIGESELDEDERAVALDWIVKIEIYQELINLFVDKKIELKSIRPQEIGNAVIYEDKICDLIPNFKINDK
jgi:hypothetical protein